MLTLKVSTSKRSRKKFRLRVASQALRVIQCDFKFVRFAVSLKGELLCLAPSFFHPRGP